MLTLFLYNYLSNEPSKQALGISVLRKTGRSRKGFGGGQVWERKGGQRGVSLSWDWSLPLSVSLLLWSCWTWQHRQNCCLICLLPPAYFGSSSLLQSDLQDALLTHDLYKLWLCQFSTVNWQEINDTKTGDQLDFLLDPSNSEISLLLLIATCFCWW